MHRRIMYLYTVFSENKDDRAIEPRVSNESQRCNEIMKLLGVYIPHLITQVSRK